MVLYGLTRTCFWGIYCADRISAQIAFFWWFMRLVSPLEILPSGFCFHSWRTVGISVWVVLLRAEVGRGRNTKKAKRWLDRWLLVMSSWLKLIFDAQKRHWRWSRTARKMCLLDSDLFQRSRCFALTRLFSIVLEDCVLSNCRARWRGRKNSLWNS